MMIPKLRALSIVVASALCAQAAVSDDKVPAPLLIGDRTAAAWSGGPEGAQAAVPLMRPAPVLASFLPSLPSSFFGTSASSHLLFLSPLSPLRAALRLAAQDLAAQTPTALDPSAPAATTIEDPEEASDSAADTISSAASRRRDVLLRQRRKSVLNDRETGTERRSIADGVDAGLELAGLNGRVELRALPPSARGGGGPESRIPGGAGLVRVSGNLTNDLAFALTGLAADSAATSWRAGAEFELAAGDRNRIEAGAVYGTRFNALSAASGGEVDRRSVGAFRVVNALRLFENVTTTAGGRFIDAPYLASPRSIDPEFAVVIEQPEGEGGAISYLRVEVLGDTLFPGLEVATGHSDLIALSESLPVMAADFDAQHTWNRGVAVGYRDSGFRVEGKVQDQVVTNALLVLPSSIAGAPFVANGRRPRVQIGSAMMEKTFAHGQAQVGIEYGFGRFSNDASRPGRLRDFHQLTTRLDAYLRRTGTGLAVFHRVHEGASVASREDEGAVGLRAQRYLVELRQDVPFLPSVLGADMAVLVSLRNVYYDDVERRNVDEFAVAAPPRRLTGGIRVKF